MVFKTSAINKQIKQTQEATGMLFWRKTWDIPWTTRKKHEVLEAAEQYIPLETARKRKSKILWTFHEIKEVSKSDNHQ